MKTRICVLAAVMSILCLLAACSFTTNRSGNIGMVTAESTAKVEEMMLVLADGDMDAALSLMYPAAAETAQDALAQMCDYLTGRKVAELNQQSVSVNTSSGTSGRSRQETAVFQAVLEDGTEIYLSTAYYSDNSGEGFISFRIVLGVV